MEVKNEASWHMQEGTDSFDCGCFLIVREDVAVSTLS